MGSVGSAKDTRQLGGGGVQDTQPHNIGCCLWSEISLMSRWLPPLRLEAVGPGPRRLPNLPLIRNKQIEAVKQYASLLFPASQLFWLLMDFNVLKLRFKHASEPLRVRGGRL